MRVSLAAFLVLAAVGCAAGPESTEGAPMRLFVAGTVDLTGSAALVAEADPEGVLREVRLMARRADLAIVVSVQGEADRLLAAAGFDAVSCPNPESLTPAHAGLVDGPGAVWLMCGAGPGLRTGDASRGLLLAVSDATRPGTGAAHQVGDSPVEVIVFSPGPAGLVVSGLGALVSGDPSATGAVIEVIADEEGVIAYRIGRITLGDLRVHFEGWDMPTSDAALLDGSWWTLAETITPAPVLRPPSDIPFEQGELSVAALGDITGDGRLDMAAAYRHPFRRSALSDAFPGAVGVDSQGRSAHLGVFTPEGEALWAAGLVPHPIGDLAACDGSLAFAYTGLDEPEVTGTGAGVWQGLDLRPAPDLPGSGVPGCADVDGDGRLDPVILQRSPEPPPSPTARDDTRE